MKGQLEGLAIGVVLAIVTLFIGLYAIAKVADLQPASSLYDYVYTTTTNATQETINDTIESYWSFDIGAIQTIEGETAIKRIDVIANNTGDVAGTINVTLNGVSLGDFTAAANANTSKQYNSVNFVEGGQNNITVGCDIAQPDSNISVVKRTIKYPSSNSTTDFYGVYTGITTNTSTIFDVLILVIIIVALGVAIAVLRGFGRTPSRVSTAV